jgi:uncharacterized Fe-S cluster-containing radical SAM superfamily protein
LKFPWKKYSEVKCSRRNTLQVFITNKCNLKCNGCFARNIISGDDKHISLPEYRKVVSRFIAKGGRQINLLGGEPLLHPKLREIIAINRDNGIKTTIYTNGTSEAFSPYFSSDFEGVKLRVAIYSYKGGNKSCLSIPTNAPQFDANFMVSAKTILGDLVHSAARCEFIYGCKVFFISSIRELDNERKEFFDDTELTMPLLKYKELVHKFLYKYDGDMDIHVSKRGVFESTTGGVEHKCRFANYFIGGRIIQCPYDVVNKKFKYDYRFGVRNCQHNSSCLMSKVIYKRR